MPDKKSFPCEPLSVDEIITDAGTQMRAEINSGVVEDYAEIYGDDDYGDEGGQLLPPLVVFKVGKKYILADGFHRLDGAKLGGRSSVPCEIHAGTLADAILWAAGANHKHGLRRTVEDKRRATLGLLTHAAWGKKTMRWIAENANVSLGFVSNLKKTLGAPEDEKPADLVHGEQDLPQVGGKTQDTGESSETTQDTGPPSGSVKQNRKDDLRGLESKCGSFIRGLRSYGEQWMKRGDFERADKLIGEAVDIIWPDGLGGKG